MYYTHLIFDFDGTLFDSRTDIVVSINHTRKAMHLPELEYDAIIKKVGGGMAKLIKDTFPEIPDQLDKAKSILMEYYNVHHSDFTKPYSGVMETLKKLEQDLFIISNKPKELVEAVLESFQLTSLFKKVIGGESLEEKKPHPMTLESIEKDYPGKRSQMLIIGDLEPDLQLALNTGVKSVYCAYGFSQSATLKADFTINQFDELLSIVQ